MKLLKLTLSAAANESCWIALGSVQCYWKFADATRVVCSDGRFDVKESPKKILELITELESDTKVAGKGQD